MASQFTRLSHTDEVKALPWQTTRLANRSAVIPRLAHIVAVLEQHFLPSPQWRWTINQGSVTFRHKGNPQYIVRAFFDDGGRLAEKYGLSLPSDDCLFVGMDLTGRALFERYTLRKELRRRFTHQYLDPEAGHSKIVLQPDYRHFLELIYLPPGPCDFTVDESRVVEIEQQIRAVVTAKCRRGAGLLSS